VNARAIFRRASISLVVIDGFVLRREPRALVVLRAIGVQRARAVHVVIERVVNVGTDRSMRAGNGALCVVYHMRNGKDSHAWADDYAAGPFQQLLMVRQDDRLVFFRTQPRPPVLIGGTIIVRGGFLVSLWSK